MHEPDPADMAARYGAETPVLDWRERLVCSPVAAACRADMMARVKCARSRLLPPRIMSRQTVHCSSLIVAPTEGGPSGPQCLSMPSVQGAGRLIREGSYGRAPLTRRTHRELAS
jgi:hypothetical protein